MRESSTWKPNKVSVMLNVKVSSRGSGREPNIAQFVGNDEGIWDGCSFHINSAIDEADVWLVVEDVEDYDTRCVVSPDSVLFLSAETSWPPGFYDMNEARRRFLDQFAWIYTCHDIYRPNVTADLPFLPWMVNANHGPSISSPHDRDVDFLSGLSSLPKSKELSVICSTQAVTPGHRTRLRLVEALKAHFGQHLDWFGNGVNPIPDKWTGLAPYRYTIAIENHVATNIATEKIWDPYLTLTYPIYGGAPNIHEFLPEDSLLAIDIKDLNGTIHAIETLLDQDPYEQRLPMLRQARDRVVGPLNLYSRYAVIAQRHASIQPRRVVELRPMSDSSIQIDSHRGVTRTLGEQINKIGDFLVQQSIRRES